MRSQPLATQLAALVQPVQALILDMDGVLVDSEQAHMDALNMILTRPTSPAEFAALVGLGAADTWAWLHAHHFTAAPLDQFLAEYDTAIVRRLAQSVPLVEGIEQVIHAATAARLPLALATSSRRVWMEATLRGSQLTHIPFQAIVCGDEVAHPKPAPDVFLRAAALLRVAPAACLVIEDTPTGVQAARSAGMPVIARRSAWIDPHRLHAATLLVDDLHPIATALSTRGA
ncbi:MAG: HAD family phosphatase [Chloroflexaceae bacterium]|nr:HAD family phosphatase [Chloroflexaceae bacterium]